MPAADDERQKALEYCEKLKSPEFVHRTFDDLFGSTITTASGAVFKDEYMISGPFEAFCQPQDTTLGDGALIGPGEPDLPAEGTLQSPNSKK